jgi:hypothetical protein
MSFISTEKVLIGAGAEPISATNIKCAQAIIEAKRANAGVLAVGSSTVTAGTGKELIKPVAAVAQVPLVIRAKGGNGIDLNHICIIGTPGDGVNVLYEEY